MNNELKEIEILTKEQINSFEESTKNNIVFLTKNRSQKDLAELNPLVSELLEIRQTVSSLNITEGINGEKFDKANIQLFTDSKQKIKSYRAKVKRVAKDLKENPLKKQKALIAIEKSFIKLATDEYEKAEKVFAPYIEEQERIKAERQAKKDAKMQAEIEASNKIANEALAKAKITEIINEIKYVRISEDIAVKTSNLITSANEDTLRSHLEELSNNNFNSVCHGLDISLLEESVLGELRTDFANKVFNAIALVEDKITSIENKKKIEFQEFKTLEDAKSVIDEIIPPANVPAPPKRVDNSVPKIDLYQKVEKYLKADIEAKVKSQVDLVIQENCLSGDVSPSQAVELEKSVSNISRIVAEIVIQNQQ